MAVIKSYAYNDKTQLTPHFKIQEFRCKCGGKHTIKINDELVPSLEILMKAIGATKAIPSSGHRCSTHDRRVGGYGSGPHPEGNGVDICFYNGNKPINTRYVACIAQDLGLFNGIANINTTYTHIHLDKKESRIYKGDETVSYNTVTTDFYKYYKLTKNEVYKALGITASDINKLKNEINSNSVNPTPATAPTKITYKFSNKYNSQVKAVQQVLVNKGYKIAVDGIFGPKTLEALKNFSIEKNDRGPLTQQVQNRLKTLGFKSVGLADGIAGVNTMNAIKEFQKKNNLGQGYLGGDDWYYLYK